MNQSNKTIEDFNIAADNLLKEIKNKNLYSEEHLDALSSLLEETTKFLNEIKVIDSDKS